MLQSRKKRRLGSSANGIVRFRPQHKDHVWTWDFIHDRDEQGRPLKWLSLVDEYTRECLALEVERSMTALEVVDVIRQVVLIRGAPRHIRSDNGPEFIAQAIRSWLEAAAIGTLYIAPASPWENGYAESFFSRLRDELLNAELFADLREAKVLAASWQNEYNHRRPHSSLDYLTPAAFAAKCALSADKAAVTESEEKILGALPPNPRLLSPPVEETELKPKGANMVPTLITAGT